jgi:hypothetical protein
MSDKTVEKDSVEYLVIQDALAYMKAMREVWKNYDTSKDFIKLNEVDIGTRVSLVSQEKFLVSKVADAEARLILTAVRLEKIYSELNVKN